jgi:hypothetical protein
LGETPDLRYRSLPLTNALAKCLEGHVQANSVSEFETVRYGFSRRVEHDWHALNPVFHSPFGKRRPGDANNAQLSVKPWSPTASGERHPDFAGNLGGKAMEDKR